MEGLLRHINALRWSDPDNPQRGEVERTMALLEKQLKAGNGSFMFFVDGAGRALEWANSYHFQAISPSTAQREKPCPLSHSYLN